MDLDLDLELSELELLEEPWFITIFTESGGEISRWTHPVFNTDSLSRTATTRFYVEHDMTVIKSTLSSPVDTYTKTFSPIRLAMGDSLQMTWSI